LNCFGLLLVLGDTMSPTTTRYWYYHKIWVWAWYIWKTILTGWGLYS